MYLWLFIFLPVPGDAKICVKLTNFFAEFPRESCGTLAYWRTIIVGTGAVILTGVRIARV
jgi:hypothetical protein